MLDRIVAAGTPPIRQTTFHYSASDITVGIKLVAGVDALYAPRRTVLDPILVAAAREAGVVVRYGVTVVGVLRHGGRVAGVRVRDHSRRIDDLRARLVVGADGRRSTIARLVGAATTHRVRNTSAFVYGYFRGLGVGGYEWAYRPGGTAGFIPTNDHLTCVFGGHLPSHIGRGGPEVLHRTVGLADPGMGERLRSGELVSPVRTFTGQPGHLRRPWGPGWMLVGDAGSWKDPISAHGLTDALRDAELAARAAVPVLTGERDEDEAFADYERTRDRLTLPILRDSDEIAAMRWDDARIGDLLVQLNAAMKAEVESIEGFDTDRGDGGPGPCGEVTGAGPQSLCSRRVRRHRAAIAST